MADDPFKGMKDRIAAMQREAEEHQAACRATPCEQCNRHVCRTCSSPVSSPGFCEPCDAARSRQRWARRALEVIPRAFSEAALDAPWLVALVGAKVIDEAVAALAATRIVAVGPPGAGKTSLVAAMLVRAQFAFRDPSPLWVSAHAIAKARAGHPLGQGEAPLIERALRASILVVDELGGEDERYAGAVKELLFERHAQEQPTWVTTGVGPQQISDRYGGGIARRVFEDATVFRLSGRKR
jgi:DNA replication protein DnaC